MKRACPETEPVPNGEQVISEYEFQGLLEEMIEDSIIRINHLQGIMRKIERAKQHNKRITYYIKDGVIGYKENEKPQMGFKTGRK